ncbi:MAG: molybdopterin molybdotransferase MoeA [Corynebacterium sp.]|nr:molybdopterin molybdotransferase MoeA [Corynebacterium sp.]
MSTITEHLTRVLDLITPGQPVNLPLSDALGCVLAQDCHAALAVPPFSNSAMDGFLINVADLDPAGTATLEVTGDVAAGATARIPEPGCAVRIMTGAPIPDDPVPEGLAVIPVEDTSALPGPQKLTPTITITNYRGRAHIRPRGDNVAVGDRVARAGELVDASMLAGLVSAGVAEVSVHPRPTVTVLSSGDELAPAGVIPGEGQIPDSNRPMVAALLGEAGIIHVTQEHTSDDPREFSEIFTRAVTESDLVITTGGVSAGAFDVVKAVIGDTASGADMWFGPVQMQPGKPQGAGTWARADGTSASVLCLPGNPVAAFVSFLLFIRPAVDKLRGITTVADLDSRPRVTAAAGVAFPDARTKDLIVPVRLAWGPEGATATPFTRQGRGSHFVASLNGVDGFVILAPDTPGPGPGAPLQVYLT